jgi:gonadotropin-releasing hormone receptor
VLAGSGNLSLFLSVCRQIIKYRVRTRLTLLILHLSIADLIVTFFLIPMEIFWRISVGWAGGNFLCKACQFFRAFGLYLSSMIIICISMDRYFAVIHPLKVFGGRKTVKRMLGLAWVAAILCSSPQVRHFEHSGEHEVASRLEACYLRIA